MTPRIDHLVVPVPDLAAASAAYERLGVTLTPYTTHAGMGTANRACFVGSAPDDFCYVELLAVVDPAVVRAGARRHYLEAAERGGGLAALAFGGVPVEDTASAMTAAGMEVDLRDVRAGDGRIIGKAAAVASGPDFSFPFVLIEYPESWEARFERSQAAGRFAHALPLKRLDHVAVFIRDIEDACRIWAERLGIHVRGEVRAPGMVIRQLRVGAATVELIAADAPGSPLASRPPGLANVAAWEVGAPLAEVVALARERGFSCTAPAPGVLPGTLRAEIPAVELGGLAMQLLEYV